MSTIVREIYFFRVDIGSDQSGKPKLFNPESTLEHINKLPWKNSSDPKVKTKYFKDNNKTVACWVDSTTMPCKLRFGNSRRTDFPMVEQMGEVTPLEIAEDAGLVDQTHIVFLGDNIVGCEYNPFGPRITRLPFYFSEKAVGIAPPMITFLPLLRRDVVDQLNQFSYVKVFHLRILEPFAEVIKERDASLGASFDASMKAGNSDDVELILRTTKKQADGLDKRLLDTAKSLIKNPAAQYDAKKFKITGYNTQQQKMIDLDLLSDKLVSKKEIMRVEGRSRALNKISAYNAIISAYNESKEEILKSASLNL